MGYPDRDASMIADYADKTWLSPAEDASIGLPHKCDACIIWLGAVIVACLYALPWLIEAAR